MAAPWQALHIWELRLRSRSASNPGPWGLKRRVWAEWQAMQSRSA